MQLTIDTGNTRTKWTVFLAGQVVEEGIWSTQDSADLKKILQKYPIKKAIISSVGCNNPDFFTFLRDSMSLFIELTHTTLMPLRLDYLTPQTLGKDRIASAVGATSLKPHCDLLVIDLGTCITFDLIECGKDDRPCFIGGNISPGPETRFKAMHEHTSSLPLLEVEHPGSFIGKSTQDAMVSGVMHGISLEIEGYIRKLKLKYPKLVPILTGGWSPYFENQIKNCNFAVKNLVPLGLNKILEYNDPLQKK